MSVNFYRTDILPGGLVVLFFEDSRRDSEYGWESYECIIKGVIPHGGIEQLKKMITDDRQWYKTLKGDGYECYCAHSTDDSDIIYSVGDANFVIIHNYSDILYYFGGNIIKHEACTIAYNCFPRQSDTEDIVIKEVSKNEFCVVINNSTKIGFGMVFTIPEQRI
jgi:hypothetical protein